MSATSRGPSRAVKRLVVAALGLALVVAMTLGTKFLSPKEAAALNPPPFSAQTYADKTFPKVVATLTKKATDITVLAPAIDANPGAAGKRYGTDVGGGAFAYPVKATGTAVKVDANFALLKVAGLPPKDQVRIPLGAALTGTPVRDAPGTITFGDFEGQTDFQSVANQFKLKMQSEVLSKVDVKSLKGKKVAVVGAYSTGGPPHSYIIQPVSLKVQS